MNDELIDFNIFVLIARVFIILIKIFIDRVTHWKFYNKNNKAIKHQSQNKQIIQKFETPPFIDLN